jgi:SAM-dependent methyltransferase/uncharacterized protein YbaR (Trm112 family)
MSSDNIIDPVLLRMIRCPSSGLPFKIEGDFLVTVDDTRRYSVVDGIPCLIPDSAEPTHLGYRHVIEENNKQMAERVGEEEVHDFIQAMIVPTCGNLFRGTKLADGYPIPNFPTEFEAGQVLDIGCNWGRWSIAGARAGYRMVGIDIHLRSLICARHLAHKLLPTNIPLFVLGDARYLPFAPDSFEGVFSYSCLQHFSRLNVEVILSRLHHVLKAQGKSVIQMPNRNGIRSRIAIARRMSSLPNEFDVRYYSISDVMQLFEGEIGKSRWDVDCFFGLNVHARDRKLVPPHKRWIVDAADIALRISKRVPSVARCCDSLLVISTKT